MLSEKQRLAVEAFVTRETVAGHDPHEARQLAEGSIRILNQLGRRPPVPAPHNPLWDVIRRDLPGLDRR